MGLLRQLAGETVIYGISHILPRILHYIVFTIYLTYKFADPINYGIYNDLYAYSSIILIIIIMRMDTAYFRFGSREADRDAVFASGILPLASVCVLFGLFAFLYRHDIVRMLGYSGQPHYISWFSLILIFDALIALPLARLRLENKPYKFLFYRLLNVGLTILFVMFFLEIAPYLVDRGYSNFERWSSFDRKIDYVFLSNLLASGIIFVLMLPEIFRERFKFDIILWRRMMMYSLPLILVGIAGSFNQSFAVPLQKYFLGGDIQDNLSNSGVYAATAKMALLLNLFTVAFNYAAEPFFFRQYSNQHNKQIYGIVALAFTIVSCTVLLSIYLYADLFQIILGPSYREALHLLPVLLFAYLFLGLYYNVSIWYKLVDKTHIGAIISVVGALITLVISISLLPRIGYAASAWASLACYVSMVVVGYLTGRRYYPIEYPLVKICRLILITVLGIGVAYLMAIVIESLIVRLAINTLILLVFLMTTFLSERALLYELVSGNKTQ